MSLAADAYQESGPVIKIYGERNSGTHYLARLVAANLEGRMLPNMEPRIIRRAARQLSASEIFRDMYFHLTFKRNLGWKHMNPKSIHQLSGLGIDVSKLRFLMLTKNPYAWVVSMMRNPYHLGVGRLSDIDEIVSREWPCRRRENMGRVAASLIEMWCTKTKSYLNLVDQARSCLVRYEDVLVNPASSVTTIASALGLQRRTDAFVNLDLSAKRVGLAQGATFGSYQEYYLNERWRASLTPAAIATINRQLDPGLMQRVGYEIIRPAN